MATNLFVEIEKMSKICQFYELIQIIFKMKTCKFRNYKLIL